MRPYFYSFFAVAMSLYLSACDFTSGMGSQEGAPGEAADSDASQESLDGNIAAAIGTPLTKSSDAAFLYDSDLEDADESCWGARGASGYARAACREWGSIGPNAWLNEGSPARSGSKAMKVTFTKNEDVGGAGLALSADVVNVRAYYNFAEGFDFGQGVKIGRVSSFNEATQVNDIDMVMTVRSAQSSQQCGLSDMADMGIFFNGKPVGYDWGSVGAPVRFQRGRWYAIEYQVKLNRPGAKDGSVKIWVDGDLVGSKEGLNIRGKGGDSVKLNRIRVGGWYSNGANGASCKNPSGPSTMFIDDVAVGSDFIGIQ